LCAKHPNECSNEIKLLIRYGAEVDKKGGASQSTPILIASRFANPTPIEILMENGANVNIANGYGGLPIHHAIRNHSKLGDSIVLKIIDKTANQNLDLDTIYYRQIINPLTSVGNSPLILALIYASDKIVEALLKRGCDPNKLSNGHKPFRTDSKLHAMRPLSFALNHEIMRKATHIPEKINLLLSYGANKSLPNIVSNRIVEPFPDKYPDRTRHLLFSTPASLKTICIQSVSKQANLYNLNELHSNLPGSDVEDIKLCRLFIKN